MMGAVILHGGAGARSNRGFEAELAELSRVARLALAKIEAGERAFDVVLMAVECLEDAGLFIAGRGASPSRAGQYELDAAIMTGDGRAGAVAGLIGYRHPVRVAADVMQRTPHVLLAGAGAADFAREHGHERTPEETGYYRHAGANEANHALDHVGTVGCCALDLEGNLAAASSTGGVFDKIPGRVADTPIPGAGLWCDANVAVACTGQGDHFLRTAAAANLALKVEEGMSLQEAADLSLDRIEKAGGWGGLIALDRQGTMIFPVRRYGIKCAALDTLGAEKVGVFPFDSVAR